MSNKNIEIRSSEEAIDNKVIQMATTFDRSSLNVTGGCINLPQWSNGANNHNNKAITQVEPLETLVAKSYNEVSHEERGKLLNELHGVSDEIPETRELIQEHLAELDMELGKIDDKKAYELALSLSPQYVQDRRFLLMFLRADSFDVRASAMRMVRHFEEKLNLFGSDLLTKDILLSDLEDHEIQYFRCGRQQPLMQRDRSGRMISFVTRQQQTEQISIVTRMRVTWYYMMALITGDELTQKRGLVLVWWVVTNDKLTYKGQSHISRIVSLSKSLPTRNSAFHLCSNDSAVRPAINFGAHLLENRLRIRFRLHFGSAQECIYALMTFGIAKETLPIDQNNRLSLTFFQSWLAMREEKEKGIRASRASATTIDYGVSNTIVVPGQYDVLMGRGKIVESPGNNHLRYLISVHFDRYDTAARCEKNVVCLWVLGMIEKKGGMFLKKDGQKGWVRIPESKAVDKISHDFRNYRIRGTPSGALSKDNTSTKRPMDWF